MNNLITEGIIIKENKKPKINFYKKHCVTIGDMKVKGVNLHLSESRVNSPSPNPERKFIMSLRQDGIHKGEYKLTQMMLTKEELIQIRNSINEIIEFE